MSIAGGMKTATYLCQSFESSRSATDALDRRVVNEHSLRCQESPFAGKEGQVTFLAIELSHVAVEYEAKASTDHQVSDPR